MKVTIVCLLLLVLGLASAIPQWPLRYPLKTGLGTLKTELSDEAAKSQVFPASLIPILTKATPKVASGIIQFLKYAVCDNTNSQLQAYENTEERDAKIMALVEVMNDLLSAEEQFDKVKQLNMRDNRVAEIELFDWLGSVKSKLKNTFYKIKGATKSLLCNYNVNSTCTCTCH